MANRAHDARGIKVPESDAGYEASKAAHTDGAESAQAWNDAQKYSSMSYKGLVSQSEAMGSAVNEPTPQSGPAGTARGAAPGKMPTSPAGSNYGG